MEQIRGLVIEDDVFWIESFKNSIANSKDNIFEFSYVNSLQEGIRFLSTNLVDLVLLDLSLPDSLAPIDTIRNFTSAYDKSPIIILSSYEDVTLKQEAFDKGIYDFLSKSEYEISIFNHICKSSILKYMANQKTKMLANIEDIKSKLLGIYNHLEDLCKEYVIK